MLGPGVTWDWTRRLSAFRVRGCYPLWPTFPGDSATHQFCNFATPLVRCPVVPRPRTGNATRLLRRHGLASSLFARRYWGSRVCCLFLGVLRCFSSPGSLCRCYVFTPESHPMTGAEFPHSDIHGSKPDRRLTVAFRSHPRPSSVIGAKAFTVGPL